MTTNQRRKLGTAALTVILSLATSLGTVTLTRSGRPDSATAQRVQAMRRASEQAIIYDAGQKLGSGSSTCFRVRGRTLFVTAAHVVMAGQQIAVKDRYGASRVLVVRAVDEYTDVAVLECLEDVDGVLFDGYATFSAAPAGEGEWIWHVGTPGFPRKGVVSRAVVSSRGITREEIGIPEWPWWKVDVTTALAWPGCSGGGVFNAAGEWVGLVVGGSKLGVTCYIPIDMVKQVAKAKGLTWIFD